jgi:DNA-binding transcriptional ArsR family regulator
VDSVDQRVLCHPLRVRVLVALGGGPASAGELARSLSHPIRKIAYHLTVLTQGGFAEPVDGDTDSHGPRYESSRT